MVLDFIVVLLFHLQILICVKVVIFGVYNSLSVHISDKKKDILVFSKGTTQELDDTTITVESENFTNFSRSGKKLCLSLHNNRSKRFLFVNDAKEKFQKI